MRKAIILLGAIIAISLCFDGCKKEIDAQVPGMNLISLVSGPKGAVVDLLSGSTVTNVSSTYNIIATFSNDININTITKTTVTITHDTSKLLINFVIVGKVLYIAPTTVLLTGAHLRLTIKPDTISSINDPKSTYAGTTIDFITAGVGIDTPPESTNQILYVQFNGNVNDLTDHDSVTFSSIGYTVDRFGIAGMAGLFTPSYRVGDGSIVEFLKFDSVQRKKIKKTPAIPTSMTISLWLNIANLDYRRPVPDSVPARPILGLGAELGFYLQIQDSVVGPSGINFLSNYTTDYKKFTPVEMSYSGHYRKGLSVESLLTDGWHHLVITCDSITATSPYQTMYIDGKQIQQLTVTATGGLGLYSSGQSTFDPNLTLGYYGSRENADPSFNLTTDRVTFDGAMDDLRIYNVALSQADVLALYNQEKPIQ